MTIQNAPQRMRPATLKMPLPLRQENDNGYILSHHREKHTTETNARSQTYLENTFSVIGTKRYDSSSISTIIHGIGNSNKLWMILGIFILVPWIPYISSTIKANKIQKEISILQENQINLMKELRITTGGVSNITEQTKTLETSNNQLLQDLKIHGDDVDTKTIIYKAAERREETLLNRIDKFHEDIKAASLQQSVEKWGKGPFRVEVTLRNAFANSGWDKFGNTFVIETAPLEIMPHAVYHFLKMIDLKLWDGLTFVNRFGNDAPPILQATPLSADTAEWTDNRFISANLTQMAFTEYSASYLPEKYTVAFAGRPGGPDFYVNMEEFHNGDEDGESVFGVIVKGRDLVDGIMERAKVRQRTYTVAIESLRLMDYNLKTNKTKKTKNVNHAF